MSNMFRLLRADEIDCRVSTVKQNGLSLLLYKDARCDQNILDETVGPMNWQKRYTRDNANCTVSIWDEKKQIWISKEDTGTESFTEKEKGLASDSFKRACFNWGIGRELYTAPFIWIDSKQCEIKPKERGQGFICYDRFSVSDIGYDNAGRINYLKIKNKEMIVFEMTPGEIINQTIGKTKAVALAKFLFENKANSDYVCQLYKVNSLEELTERKHQNIHRHIEEIRKGCDEWKAKAGSQT